MDVHIRLHYYADDSMPISRDVTEMLACNRLVAYDGPMTVAHENSDEFLCEDAFAQFNHGSGQECAASRGMRSLSVGDVVEIVRPGNGTFWLCQSAGWVPIEGVRSRKVA